MKSVLGIDIGLRNMSMCVITEDRQILLWDVYDILAEDTVLCDTCSRNAKYIKDSLTFCGTHFKGDKKVKKNQVKKKKVKQYSLQEIASKVISRVNTILEDNKEIFDQLTSCILELQPAINPKMKFTSHILYGKLCDIFLDKSCSIKFERANQKLKKYTGDKGQYIKNTYKNRKMKAIEYVNNILQGDCLSNGADYVDYFSNIKKKDDASDALLIAFNCVDLKKY